MSMDSKHNTRDLPTADAWEAILDPPPGAPWPGEIGCHRLIMRLFPDGLRQDRPDNGRRPDARVLWSRPAGSDQILVRSSIPPVATSAGPVRWAPAVFPEPGEDDLYRFTLVGNPVKRELSHEPGRRGAIRRCDPEVWLRSRIEKCGFIIAGSPLISDVSWMVGSKEDPAGAPSADDKEAERDVKSLHVTFSGLLKPQRWRGDPDDDEVAAKNEVAAKCRRDSWLHGIGRGKAYGAGLLILEPA